MVFIAPEDTNPPEDSKVYNYTSKYPFQLSTWQLWAIHSIINGDDVLCCAPTGSGKTLPAMFAIEYFKSIDKKVIYCSPIKALSNYMKEDFQKQFPDISFGIITGDNKDNPDADCIICTTECLRNYMFSDTSKSTALNFDMNIKDDVGIIIYDEAHYFNDEDRGCVWESCFIKQPPNVQKLLMSATLHKPEAFAQWLQDKTGSKENNICLAQTFERAVPLEHFMYFTVHPSFEKKIRDKKIIADINALAKRPILIKDKKTFYQDNVISLGRTMNIVKSNNVYVKRQYVLNNIVQYLHENDKLPGIIFVYSRQGVELFAKDIVHNLHTDPSYPNIVGKVATDILREKLANYNEYITLPEFQQITKLLEKGIGIHHGGMLPVFRELIEKMFKRGFIKLLVATETFAVGINLPCKTTVFPSLTKWDGSKTRLLQGHEYIQQAGRAGRRGFDVKGEVFHCVNLFSDIPHHIEYEKMLMGKPQELISKFRISYEFVLNVFTVMEKLDKENILDFAKNSMVVNELEKEVEYYIKTGEELQKQLQSKQEQVKYMQTSIETIKEYEDCETKLPFSKKKQRKQIERTMDNIKENKTFEKDYTLYKSINELEKQIEANKRYHDNTKDYIKYNVLSVFEILVNNHFINCENNTISIPVKGMMAHNIKEVHSLAIADTIQYTNYFEQFTVSDIVGYLSIFTNMNVKDDYKTFVPKSKSYLVQDAVKFTDERISAYKDEENKYQIYTATPSDIHFDLVDYMIDWCNCDDEKSCRSLIDNVTYNKDIFTGDFVKAILKINNIASEIDNLCEILGDKIQLQHKIKEVQKLTMKFIATNQSLYI